jgi:hypothetical protein
MSTINHVSEDGPWNLVKEENQQRFWERKAELMERMRQD